jgi:hypothetical protein
MAWKWQRFSQLGTAPECAPSVVGGTLGVDLRHGRRSWAWTAIVTLNLVDPSSPCWPRSLDRQRAGDPVHVYVRAQVSGRALLVSSAEPTHQVSV